MKKNSLLMILMFALVLVWAGMAFAADKAEVYDAMHRYESGQKLTGEQLNLLRSINYNFDQTGSELDNAGGPDAFGYWYKDSEEPDGPVYSWVDITGTGTMTDGLPDDGTAGPYPIGFDFTYYGNVYDSFWVQSNGTITFYDGYVSYSNYEMPTTNYGAMLAWFWNDLDPNYGDNGTVYYETTTVNGETALVISFIDYNEYPDSNGNTITAQVVLFESGDILMQYGYIVDGFGIAGGTIGIQNADGTIGLSYLYNGSLVGYPYDGLAVLFSAAGAPEPDVTVPGFVYDNDTGDPIEGATVTIGPATDVTGPDGSYLIENLFSGTDYEYTVAAAGYETQEGTINFAGAGEWPTDWYLTAMNLDADVLIFEGDLTPGSADAIEDLLNGMGYTTYHSYDIFEVDWTNYDYVFAFLGMYPNNFSIYTDSPEEAIFTGYLDAGGKLYVESGDLFGYEHPDNLMPYFSMDEALLADGSNDLFDVNGVAGTFTDGYYYVYGGENSWVDHIAPAGDAVQVFTNPTDDAGCGVTFDAGDYMTATFSFEVGMLEDGDFTKAEFMNGLMDWFGGEEPPPPTLSLVLTPYDPVPIEIPADGGYFEFDATVTNNTGDAVTFDFWTKVVLPDGSEMDRAHRRVRNITIEPYATLTATFNQCVPWCVPPGEYYYYGNVGVFQSDSWATDGFTIIKTGGGHNAKATGTEWNLTGWGNVEGNIGVSELVPDEFAINNVYPNPFNPTTTVSIALPTAADLTVTVFNTLGQKVAVLANGRYAEGYHNLTFNGSNLSSGIYFVQASVPGMTSQMQKIMLVK